ncbi:Cystinosin [Taenia solium]|eukprot:TsM_000271300 transcript=TsM_000271300 gene=TsM_000271300
MNALEVWISVGIFLLPSNIAGFPPTNDSYAASNIAFNPLSIGIAMGEVKRFSIKFREPLPIRSKFTFTYRNSAGVSINDIGKLPIKPLDSFTAEGGSNKTHQTSIFTKKPGKVELGLASVDLNITHLERLHTSINVYRQRSLSVLQQIVGWTYFLAWTLSFYPQVVLNCLRQSVTGLSFDFIVFNVIGFACYSAFNIGLYFVPRIKAQYFARHPLGVIPVEINDLFFSLHGLFIMLVVIVQCLIFERGSQRVSKICITLSCLMLLFILTSTLLAAADAISWLTALYLYSYVKLFVTLIKYFPQLILNCRRRSCVGWSLCNFILDFIGGVLSIAQMLINAYNYDDWSIVYGSPTKLCLGLFSIAFDCGFFIQHHLYRGRTASTEALVEVDTENSEAPTVNESANTDVNA